MAEKKKKKIPSKSGRGRLFETINCEQDNKTEIKKPKSHIGNGPISFCFWSRLGNDPETPAQESHSAAHGGLNSSGLNKVLILSPYDIILWYRAVVSFR